MSGLAESTGGGDGPRARFVFTIATWGAALEKCRFDADASYRDVANCAGVSRAVVKEVWVANKGFPNIAQIKRLYGFLRRLRHYAYLLPKETRDEVEQELQKGSVPVAEIVVPTMPLGLPPLPERPRQPSSSIGSADAPPAMAEPAQAPAEPEVQEIDKPKEFHDALRLARRLEGLTLAEVGDLIGVEQGTVSKWELGTALPIRAHYLELLNLFEQLRELPEPHGLRDIPKPVGPAGRKMPPAPPRGPTRNGDGFRVDPSPAAPAPDPVVEEVLAATLPAPPETIESLALEHAKVLLELRRAEGRAEVLRAALADTTREIVALQQRKEEALRRLEAEAARIGGAPGGAR